MAKNSFKPVSGAISRDQATDIFEDRAKAISASVKKPKLKKAAAPKKPKQAKAVIANVSVKPI
jgi:hypothetical protein